MQRVAGGRLCQGMPSLSHTQPIMWSVALMVRVQGWIRVTGGRTRTLLRLGAVWGADGGLGYWDSRSPLCTL